MQFSKWGNLLVARFRAGLVQALDLKQDEEIDLQLVGARAFGFSEKLAVKELSHTCTSFAGVCRMIFISAACRPSSEETRLEQAPH